MANITFLSFLLFSMCHSIHVAVNTWINCSFFTLMVNIDEAVAVLTIIALLADKERKSHHFRVMRTCVGFWLGIDRCSNGGFTARPTIGRYFQYSIHIRTTLLALKSVMHARRCEATFNDVQPRIYAAEV